ncbi:Nn.00g063780.m01.CDS01 [Neocucurbitaria sp. VM-36]
MSAYKGHRGPNVSQYIANLNQLSPPQDQDLLSEPQPVEEDFSAFLNADFFDVNSGRNVPVDFTSPIDFDVDIDTEQTQQPKTGAKFPHPTANTSDEPNMDFSLNGDFQFTDFNNFGQSAILDPSLQGLPQPNHYPLPATYASPTSSISPVTGIDQASKKRKLENVVPVVPQSLDENARVAAEEDKRRRNTAASARFRVKKKQREQALEKTAKDMSDKVNMLEVRIQQLETENAWLKGLITEKNGGKSSTSELRALISKHEEANNGRSSSAHTDGVGTKAQSLKADA